MSKELLSHDPLSGMSTYTADEDGKTFFGYEQDVEPELDYSKSLANNEEYSRGGIKAGLWHYGHIPQSVLMKMICEDHINPFTKEGLKDVFRLLNTKYQYCKTTTLYHEARGE